MGITIIDVAKKANVSKSTASRVLAGDDYGVSENSRKSVMEAAKALGYCKNNVAMSLRTTRTRSILLIIPDIRNDFWSEVARGAQDFLDTIDYSLVLANSDWNIEHESKYFEFAKSSRVDAIILNSPFVSEENMLKLDVPVVIVGDRLEHLSLPIVGTDSRYAIEKALQYLYDKGHRRIAMTCPTIGKSHLLGVRGDAYRNFMKTHGLDVEEELLSVSPLTVESGRAEADRFASMENPPTAVLCGNDLVASGFLQRAAKLGIRIPEDVSVMGIDGNSMSEMTSPALSTIQKYPRQIGMEAAKIAIDKINGKDVPLKTLLTVEVIERESVRSIDEQQIF